MASEKNSLVLKFDDKTLNIWLNGKLIAIYSKEELSTTILDFIFNNLRFIMRPPPGESGFFDVVDVGFRLESVGPCVICSRHANLLGGLCWDCSNSNHSQPTL
jgi:hypothetical protein